MEKGHCLICDFDNYQRIASLKYDYLNRFNTDFHLVKCCRCGFHYLYPLPKDEDLIEIYSDEYHFHKEKWLYSIFGWFFGLSLIKDASLIKKYKKRGTILDIGGGSGKFLDQFSTGWTRYYVDPSSSAVGTLSKDIKIFNKFLEECHFDSELFDVIVLRNVLEHTSNPYPLLKEISRVLKVNGILFIRMPNIKSVDFKIFKEHWYVIQDPGHIVFYSLDVAKKLFGRVGLNVIRSKTTIFSAPLSLFRSYYVKRRDEKNWLKKVRVPIILILSVLYSFVSFSFPKGKGGEMKLICMKK